MKYQAAMKKKLSRIGAYVQREVEVGKCSQSDIEHIARHILMTVTPYTRAHDDGSYAAYRQEQEDFRTMSEEDKELKMAQMNAAFDAACDAAVEIPADDPDYHRFCADMEWWDGEARHRAHLRQIDAEIEMQILRMKEDPF